MEIIEHFVAIDNKCAWPNLTRMPDGALVATIFGEPCHGSWEGAPECWISRDEGRTWTFLSIPVPNDPGTNRMNLAAGMTPGGAFVVLCSGWSHRPPRGGMPEPGSGRVLTPRIGRSEDGGQTWTQSEMPLPDGLIQIIPFGNIIVLPGNRLAVSCYGRPKDRNERAGWILYSEDDGRTWGEARDITGPGFVETDLLYLEDDKRLLAASRSYDSAMRTVLFVSEDEGRTWLSSGPVTHPGQVPAHLCRLRDGRVLLSYGVRNPNMLGVCARISADGGKTWDAPRWLFCRQPRSDGGYPASVEGPDGVITTAYYCKDIPSHQRYHMGIVRWRTEAGPEWR